MSMYYGPRDDDFTQFIKRLLRRGNIREKYIENLTDEESLKFFSYAFTASSCDRVNNYERFEQIGDVSVNKFIVWYFYSRFPQLDCTEGVKIVARLRINYGAKKTFASIAESLGFWDFISAQEDGEVMNSSTKYRNRHKKDLLEDTFEAFIGCVEYILDKKYRPGVGYGIVYDILTSIFDDLGISLRFEDLYDAKTRLKETFDIYQELGDWAFIDNREQNPENTEFTFAKSKIYLCPPGTTNVPIKKKTGPNKNDVLNIPQKDWVVIGEGTAASKNEAQQKAAQQAINYLKRQGVYREPPEIYSAIS